MRVLIPAAVALTACTASPDTDDGNTGTDPDLVTETCGVEVGRCAPAFSLPDTTGAFVSLSERGGQRAILVGSAMW